MAFEGKSEDIKQRNDNREAAEEKQKSKKQKWQTEKELKRNGDGMMKNKKRKLWKQIWRARV